MSTNPPIYSIFCIDYRFDALVATFYEDTGNEFNYFASTAAGGALALGYKKYCKTICHPCNKKKSCKGCKESKCCKGCKGCPDKKSCDPNNSTMKLFKDSLVENLNVGLTLYPVKTTYLLNHQDCGAMKAFLSCSGYPETLGEDNPKEIQINATLLTFANDYMLKNFPTINFKLGLVDINGSVAIYNLSTKIWTVEYVGEFDIKEGLWYGLKVGDTYK